MPSAMTDILDAPVPFLVGLHSQYLTDTPPEQRPQGVVFVDLDNDIVHLGLEDDSPHRRTPCCLPERDVHKLKLKLDEYAAVAYLSPPDGAIGRITTGTGELLPNHMRENYAVNDNHYHMQFESNDGTDSNTATSSQQSKKRTASFERISSKNLNSREAILRQSDLAYPNNEHLLPINNFATEQGMVMKKNKFNSSNSNTGSSGSSRNSERDSNLVSGNMEQLAKNLLDVSGNENGNDGFSTREIRNAFLRFFVSILRHYDKFVPKRDSTKPFDRTAFLRESSHIPNESNEFMQFVLQSQMFERFIEERITSPDEPEIRFFNESIIQKMNRNKSGSMLVGRRKETPFLSDQSHNVNETYTPPAPSNWGLPDDGRIYSYASFPSLNTSLFGNTRQPRQLLKGPEQQRTVVSNNNQDILMRSVGGGSSNRGNNEKGSSKNKKSGSSQANDNGAQRTNDLEWALFLLVFQQNTNAKKNSKGEFPASTIGDSREAGTIVGEARTKQFAVIKAVVSIQATFVMRPLRRQFLALKKSALFICKFYKRVLILRTYRDIYREVLKIVKIVQKIFRGFKGRQKAKLRERSIVDVQRFFRGWTVRGELNLMVFAATTIQAAERGRRARFAFALVRDLIIGAQAAIRGCFKRKIAHRERVARLKEYRAQMFELWNYAHTPLAYRSKVSCVKDAVRRAALAVSLTNE